MEYKHGFQKKKRIFRQASVDIGEMLRCWDWNLISFRLWDKPVQADVDFAWTWIAQSGGILLSIRLYYWPFNYTSQTVVHPDWTLHVICVTCCPLCGFVSFSRIQIHPLACDMLLDPDPRDQLTEEPQLHIIILCLVHRNEEERKLKALSIYIK